MVNPWLAHRYLLNGHVMLIDALVQPIIVIPVAARQPEGRWNSRYPVNDIVADIRALNVIQDTLQACSGRRSAPTA